jgi:hypothetical protein
MGKPYSSRTACIRLAQQDVERVTLHACHILLVNEDGSPRTLESRDPAPLNTLVVLGPGFVSGIYCEALVLLEIGLGRARPYHPARAPAGTLSTRWIAQRRRYAILNASQLANAWPTISDILASHAQETVARWAYRSWNIASPRACVRRVGRTRTIHTYSKEVAHARGVYVSVSSDDVSLIKHFQEQECRSRHHTLVAQATLIAYCLRNYRYAWYEEKRLRAYARGKASGLRLLCEKFGPKGGSLFGRLLPHHVAYMYTHGLLPPAIRPLLERCAEVFDLFDVSQVSSTCADTHLTPQEKFTVRALPKRRTTADYVVFELVPKPTNGGFSSEHSTL